MNDAPVALVTGASRGIGRGLAEAFMKQGHRVVGCSRGDAPKLAGAYEHHRMDVTDDARVREVVGEVAGRLGRIDVLVNNAGIGLASLALMTRSESADATIRTNLLGAMTVSREVGRVMAGRRAGRIISIGSVAVPLRMEGASAYSAAKAGLMQFAKTLARELAPLGVTSNVVAPSLVETDMMASLSEAARRAYLDSLTIRRPATLSDVWNAVWFFARPESSCITGQVLYLGLVD